MIRRSLALLLLLTLMPWARGEAQCTDLAKLAEPELTPFTSLYNCEKSFKPDHEAALTDALAAALKEEEGPRVEELAALWQQIFAVYAKEGGYKSSTVQEALARSLRSDPVRKAIGEPPTSFVVAPAGESMADSVSYLLQVAQRLRAATVATEIGFLGERAKALEAKISKQEEKTPSEVSSWQFASLAMAGLALVLAGLALWLCRRYRKTVSTTPLVPPTGELQALSVAVRELERKAGGKTVVEHLNGVLGDPLGTRLPAIARVRQSLESERAERSTALQRLGDRLTTVEQFGVRLAAVEERLPKPLDSTLKPTVVETAPPVPTNPLEVVHEAELEILRAALAQVTGGPSPWPTLLDDLAQLPAQLERYPELHGASQEAVAPVRGQIDLAARLRVAQKLVARSAQKLEPAKELLRLRDTIQALSPLRPPRSAPEWRPEPFVEGGFRDFADLFHQTLQRERFEGRGQRLAAAAETVSKTLAAAGIEVIEIELGRDLFDPSRHVGRGTSTLPNLQDGAITGVVRNGFRRLEGRAVFQLPEVIVNRIS